MSISSVETRPGLGPDPHGSIGVDLAPGPERPRRGLLRVWGLVVAVAVLGVVVVCSIAFGARDIPLGTVWDAIFHTDSSITDHQVVQDLRLPRTGLGLLAGMALGLAGTVMQGLTRNPLADPGIFGVEAGASLGIVIAIFVFDIATLNGYIWFGLLGAAVASVAVYILGSLGPGGATPVKLALAGAVFSVLLMSFVHAILLVDIQTLDRFRMWVVGSLAGRDPDVLTQGLPFFAVGVVLAFGTARTLNTLALGDDVARSLGQRIQLARATAALAVVVLSGAAVAIAGPIGFIGLAVPHMARAITGPDYRWVIPWSMLLGPILLLGADVIGRVIDRPSEVQVGVVTAVLGAPLFIVLIRRLKLAEL